MAAPPPAEPPADDGIVRRCTDWFFRSRSTGQITIAQFPNLPLAILVVTMGLRVLVDDESRADEVLGWVGLAALAWWAVDEIVRGVNPWRRLLGVGGCVLVLSGVAARLS